MEKFCFGNTYLLLLSVLLCCHLISSVLTVDSNPVNSNENRNITKRIKPHAANTLQINSICIDDIDNGCGTLEYVGCSKNKKFYVQENIKYTWFEAWEFCRSQGKFLASIENREEQRVVEFFLTPYSGEYSFGQYWTSGTDLGRESLFLWLGSGKPFGSFQNWNINEPNNANLNEHCVQMESHRDSFLMKWNDIDCMNSAGFALCQDVMQK